MKIALLCATAALAAAPVFADELVASNGQDSVRLTDKPCSAEPVLQRLTPKIREMMREANAVVSGQQFRACWVVNGDSAHLLYEDGDQGLIPLTDFKQPKTA
jgi:hypothetical protein